MNEDWDKSPLGFYCRACSAAPGTPCSDPGFGVELLGYHNIRVLDGGFIQPRLEI